MQKKKLILTALCAIFITMIFVKDAAAIPTFARKYRTSCTTCHVGFNRLNPFGIAYRQNGYQVPEGDAAYVKQEPVSLGAPAWSKVWPEAVWPGAIPGFVPISMMVHQRAVWDQEDEQSIINFDFPFEWALFVGGDIGEMMSFFGEFIMYEDGEVEGTERLFFQFNDLLTGDYGFFPENALNIKIGRFDVAADPFSAPIRRTLNRYLMSDHTVGNGAWRLRNYQSGIEANGILARRFKYAVGVVNGNSALGGDDNQDKDFYYRAAYKFGGMALDGSGEDELGEELKQTKNWAERSIEIGTFGYVGAEEIAGLIDDYNNKFYRIGGDAQIQYGNLQVLAAMMYGYNDREHTVPYDIETVSWLTQGEYVIFPWLISTLRYEGLRYEHEIDPINRFVSSLAIYPRANTRLIIEYLFYPDDEDGNDRLLLDFAYLF